MPSPTTTPSKDPPARGIRGQIRRAIHQAHKYDLGCPTEEQCGLFAKQGIAACGPCPKHLKPAELDVDVEAIPRIRFLFWLESLIEAGAQFHAGDVPISAWNGLIDIKRERGRMERILHEARSGKRAEDQETAKALSKARAIDKIPGPGQSLFGARKK